MSILSNMLLSPSWILKDDRWCYAAAPLASASCSQALNWQSLRSHLFLPISYWCILGKVRKCRSSVLWLWRTFSPFFGPQIPGVSLQNVSLVFNMFYIKIGSNFPWCSHDSSAQGDLHVHSRFKMTSPLFRERADISSLVRTHVMSFQSSTFTAKFTDDL